MLLPKSNESAHTAIELCMPQMQRTGRKVEASYIVATSGHWNLRESQPAHGSSNKALLFCRKYFVGDVVLEKIIQSRGNRQNRISYLRTMHCWFGIIIYALTWKNTLGKCMEVEYRRVEEFGWLPSNITWYRITQRIHFKIYSGIRKLHFRIIYR